MSNEPLARQVGRLLRMEREAAGLNQTRFAVRAGVSQQCVSHFERGTSAPTTTLVERLFGALGKQLRLEVEERDADLDATMDAVTGRDDVTVYRDDDGHEVEVDDIDVRVWELGVLHRWAPPGLVYLLDGELAAALQGVPIRPTRLDLAVAEGDLPLLDEWIRAIPNCLRWVPRWRDFSGYDISPLRPGPLRWMSTYGELRVRLLPGLPAGIAVTASGRELSLRPLVEVERDEPQIGRIAARARTRAASGVRSG